MKKGFTLIELTGVILVLGIIALITFPVITNMINESKNKAYRIQENQIKTAVKDYIAQNPQVTEIEGDSFSIFIGELKHEGLLPINFINAKTNKNISNQSKITVTKTNDSYSYDIVIEDLEENSTQNENSPIVILNGDYVEYVEINTPYIEKGATARDINGNSIEVDEPIIKLNDRVESSIETSTKQTYKVIYRASSNGLETISIRTIIIRDTVKPVIVFPNNNELKVSQVNGFNVLEGVFVNDNSNEIIIPTYVSTISNLPGDYAVTYNAIDSSGNEEEIRRIITVIED